MTSTNDEAKRLLAESHHRFPMLVLTQEQTVGRGQRGRRWWSGQGCLTCSFVIPFPSASLAPPVLALATALSVSRAIEETSKSIEKTIKPRIKWPNDVYIGRKKASGILIESVASANQRNVIIGIGCNINCSAADIPNDLEIQATSLFDETGIKFDITQFLIRLLHSLTETLKQTATDPCSIVTRCQERSYYPIGAPLEVTVGEHCSQGTFGGFATGGELILCRNNQTDKIVSGTATVKHAE